MAVLFLQIPHSFEYWVDVNRLALRRAPAQTDLSYVSVPI